VRIANFSKASGLYLRCPRKPGDELGPPPAALARLRIGAR